VTKAGGKVVKNVAGYDLMKLYTGSYGTLSIIAELSFKLRPQPAAETTLLGVFTTLEQLMEAARLLLASQLAPVALELLSGRALRVCFPEASVSDERHALAVRLAGLPEALQYQRARIPDVWQGLASEIIEVSGASREGWRRVADFAEHYGHQISLRISVLPSRLPSMMALVREQFSQLASDFELLSHVGNGIARVFVNVGSEEIAEEKLPKWRAAVMALREEGSVIIERAPLALKQQIDVWGEARSTAEIMRVIKQKLDPKGILNPGRFVAGI
jgi:glycolate oxidase FAD binding subunit